MEIPFPMWLPYHARASWLLLLIGYDRLKVKYTYNVSADQICGQNYILSDSLLKKK